MNSFLIEAITQGKVLKSCLDFYIKESRESLKSISELYKENGFTRILFSGMGSSYYAPFAVVDYLIGKGVPSVVLNAYEVAKYQTNIVTEDTMLVVVSQSGKTWEVLETVEKLKDRTKVVGVVNVEDSRLAELVDFPLWIKAGKETQISNKSFLCSLAVLNLLAAELVGQLDQDLIDQLYMLADWIDEYLSNLEDNLKPLEAFVKDTTNYDFIANGPSFSSAFQAGLVFREGPKVITATNNCADYAHGWDKSAQAGYMGLVHAPGYDSDSVEARMLKSLLEKGAKVILLTDLDIQLSKEVYIVKHPQVYERLAPLPQIVITSALMGWLMGEKSDRE